MTFLKNERTPFIKCFYQNSSNYSADFKAPEELGVIPRTRWRRPLKHEVGQTAEETLDSGTGIHPTC